MTKIALNGFGRIGRNAFKIMHQRNVQIEFINDLTDAHTLAYLLKHDSVHRSFNADIKSTDNSIIVNGREIPVFAEKDPTKLPSKNIDLMIEGTGVFTSREKMSLHLQAGAKKALLTAPAKDEIDATIVMGVNDSELKSEHRLISNASCTTNCLAPLAFILEKEFGIISGFMNTAHSYTNDQNLLDLPHKNLRRARAAAINIVPSSTGAAKTIGLIIPELKGKLDGLALRVPTPDGSIVDLTCNLKTAVTSAEVNQAFQKWAENSEMSSYLSYNLEEIVSSDILGSSYSCIFDSTLTQVIATDSDTKRGTLVKVLGWYDNEWGYSNRTVDLATRILSL
ncbi:MAG: type I glyceraldehyde-3-phosphate dehydrogenase [Patescibacteria group bacterium]